MWVAESFGVFDWAGRRVICSLCVYSSARYTGCLSFGGGDLDGEMMEKPTAGKPDWKLSFLLLLLPVAGLCAILLLLQEPHEESRLLNDEIIVTTAYPATHSSRLIAMSAICGSFGGAMIVAIATRRTRGFMAGTSAVLLVGILSIWVRSHFRSDHVNVLFTAEHHRPHRGFFISGGGGLLLGFERYPYSEPFELTLGHESRRSKGRYPVLSEYVPKTAKVLGRSGFGISLGTHPDFTIFIETDGDFIAAPYWFLAVLTAIAPAVWLRRAMRRRRRRRRGLCLVCGYDLRASAERCPECGTAVSPRNG